DRTGRIEDCYRLPQLSYLCPTYKNSPSLKRDLAKEDGKQNTSKALPDILLASHEICLKDKRAQAHNFALVETASNQMECGRIIQQVGSNYVIINPPYPISKEKNQENHPEIDAAFDLPYTRYPHPKYRQRGEIPAYTMIRHSVNIHRGCFGGCAFCTISAHQGKQVQSRSESSILKEIEQVVAMDDFKGYLSDLGGPSANMYGMQGKDGDLCRKCKRPSCIFPSICGNLQHDHARLVHLYQKVSSDPRIKKCFIGSGVRYDLILPYLQNKENHARDYAEMLIRYGVSGRLKVAPEHTEASVLKRMRKMPFEQFEQFKRFFDATCSKYGLNQQLIPYFISAHPGCRREDMQALQIKTQNLGYHLEQVQLFTPTPMTLATEMYYTGLDPYSLEPVYVATNPKERDEQTSFFFWYKEEERTNRKKQDPNANSASVSASASKKDRNYRHSVGNKNQNTKRGRRR
ncbi:MAG: DUF3362 domain-containing protein, partial [Bacteroidales bacterium]